MSYELVAKIARTELGIPPLEKLLLLQLADKIDSKGYCFPSTNTLARISGMNQRTVFRCLKNLQEKELIKIESHQGKISKYFINVHLIDQIKQKLMAESHKLEQNTYDTESQGGMTESHTTPDTESGDPCHSVIQINKGTNKLTNKGSKAGSLPHGKSGGKLKTGVGKKGIQTKDDEHLPEGKAFLSMTGEPYPPPHNPVQGQIWDTGIGLKFYSINGEWVEWGSGEVIKVEDVMKGKLPLKKKKQPNPVDIWRDAVIAWREDHEVTGELLHYSKKDKGMLNQIANKLEGNYPDVVLYTVLNWENFVKFCTLVTGKEAQVELKNNHWGKPTQPHIGYFVFNANNALQFYTNQLNLEAKQFAPKFKKPKLHVTKKVLKEGKTKKLLQAAGYIDKDES